MGAYVGNPNTVKTEDQKFKAIVPYTATLRPAWTTKDKQTNKPKKKNPF